MFISIFILLNEIILTLENSSDIFSYVLDVSFSISLSMIYVHFNQSKFFKSNLVIYMFTNPVYKCPQTGFSLANT